MLVTIDYARRVARAAGLRLMVDRDPYGGAVLHLQDEHGDEYLVVELEPGQGSFRSNYLAMALIDSTAEG